MDERLMTDYDLKQERRNANLPFAHQILDHCDAVNERLMDIEKWTQDARVLKTVREILYGED